MRQPVAIDAVGRGLATGKKSGYQQASHKRTYVCAQFPFADLSKIHVSYTTRLLRVQISQSIQADRPRSQQYKRTESGKKPADHPMTAPTEPPPTAYKGYHQ